jgi:betaine-aldehyde dehydrogenase
VVTNGQMCMACTRVLVHEDPLGQAEKILREALGSLAPADPREPTAALGPLIGPAALEKVTGYLDLARRDARLVTGGAEVHPDGLPGHFRPRRWSPMWR